MKKVKKEKEAQPYPFPTEVYGEMEKDGDDPAYVVMWENLDNFTNGTSVGVYKLVGVKRLSVRPALKRLK